jgi:DNA-binding GntR family transcriptional regulator
MSKSAVKNLAPNVSLADLVHQRIVEALVTGQFKGGEELNEVGLAAQFRVSRTPVREALRRLAAEGLVVNQRNRQTTVIQLSRQDVIETYQVRQILESSAARLAATQISAPDLQVLQTLSAATSAPSPDEGVERKFGDELHRIICDSCGNGKLQREIQRYQNLVRLVRSSVIRKLPRLTQGNAEHQQILAALEDHDPAAAAAAMSCHIDSALQVVLKVLT